MTTFTRALLLSIALMIPAFSAPLPAEEEPIRFEFWHAMGSRTGGVVNDLADMFNRSQTRYKVVPIYQGRYDSLSQKLIASLYAKRNPAVAQMYPGWTTRFLKYGYLDPLGNFIEKDVSYGQEQIDDFFPVMIDENTMFDPRTGKDALITLPFNKSVYVLYVNQTRMEELGWTHPPRTWAEMRKLAEEMTVVPPGATTPTVYGFATRTFIEDFTVQAFSADTQLYDDKTNTILIDSEPSLAAITYLKDLTSSESQGHKVGYVESDYLNAPFGSEKIGMFIGSTASFPYNDMAVGTKFVWNAYRVPSRDENTVGKTLMQGTNLGIFSNVPEEQKQGAWEFIKFVTSPEATAMWACKTGYLPVRRSALDVPELKDYMASDIRYANAVGTLDFAAYEPRRMFWESVRTAVTQEVEAVMLGRKPAGQAMKDARDAIVRVRGIADE